MAERLIRIEYTGGANYRVSRVSSMEGAFRAAMIRVAQHQYEQALIFDERFIPQDRPSAGVKLQGNGLVIQWAFEPKWKAIK